MYEEGALVAFTLQPGNVGIWRSTRRTRGLSPGIGAWVEVNEPAAWDDMTVYEPDDRARFGGRIWRWTGQAGTTSDPLTTAEWDFVRHSRQDWDPAEQIYENDLVIYDGTAWTATADSMNSQPTDVVPPAPAAPQLSAADRLANERRAALIGRLYRMLSVNDEDRELALEVFTAACNDLHGPSGMIGRLLVPARLVEVWRGVDGERSFTPWETPSSSSIFIEWGKPRKQRPRRPWTSASRRR